MQAVRGAGDAYVTWWETHSGVLGSATGAILQGHNVVACEIEPQQFSAGKARLSAEVNNRLHMRAFTKLKLPRSQVLVHKDDVDKDAEEARYLPHPRLFELREVEDLKQLDPLKVYKDRCKPLRVRFSFSKV